MAKYIVVNTVRVGTHIFHAGSTIDTDQEPLALGNFLAAGGQCIAADGAFDLKTVLAQCEALGASGGN